MRKITILIFVLMQAFSSYAQNPEAAIALIKEGVELHDKGDYNAAIQKYDEALKLDTANLTAIGEKAYSLSSLGDYDAVTKLCRQTIKSNPSNKGLDHIYMMYANALDVQKKPHESLKVYNEAIPLHPDFQMLYFNRGVTLAGLESYDEALLDFQKSVSLNPRHPGSHNAMARVLGLQKKQISSLMAFGRFMVLEPQGRRAEANFPLIQKIMAGNVEKKGKKNITINIDAAMLSDSTEKKENDFGTAYMTLALSAALDFDKKKKKMKAVERFQEKFETLCSVIQETQEDNFGFYWEYYAPYFIAMKKAKQVETFSFLVYASSDDKFVNKWLEKNEDKIKAFYKWTSDYEWPEQ